MPSTIETLSEQDLPQCLALARDRNWSVEDTKWRLLFDIATVSGFRDAGGAVIATVAHVRPSETFDFVGMLLVARDHGRSGLGRALMNHVIGAASPRPVLLYATDLGRPLYDDLGFVPIGTTATYLREPGEVPGSPRSRAATRDDLDAISELDARIYGAARPELMALLPAFAEDLRVLDASGRVTGYLATWQNADTLVVGPLAAETPDDAKVLIADVLRGTDRTVRLDLDQKQLDMHQWAAAQNFVWRNDATMMALGHGGPPHTPEVVWTPFMQAYG